MNQSQTSSVEERSQQRHSTYVADLDLLSLVKSLLKQWKLVLLVSILFGAAGAGVSYLITPMFSSTTTFLPPLQQQSSAASALASLGSLANLAGGAAGIKSPAEQYVSLMQSVSVANRMIEKFDLMEGYKAKFNQDARKALANRSQFSIGKKDGLITVTVEDSDPKRAAAMANQYVEELRRMTAYLAVSEAQQRRVFFERQLQEAKTRLTAAQIALQESGFNSGALKSEPKAAAEAYARLRGELSAAEIRLTALRSNLSEGTPEVRQLSTTVQALRARLTELEGSQAGATAGGSNYVSKYREFKYQETIFELMARQYELARVDESKEGSLIQVVDKASPGEKKIKPTRTWYVLISFVLGTLISITCLTYKFSNQNKLNTTIVS